MQRRGKESEVKPILPAAQLTLLNVKIKYKLWNPTTKANRQTGIRQHIINKRKAI